MTGIIGRKIGMTQLFTEDGERVPVTVIEAGPCAVTAVREPERDGYGAVQLAFGEVAEKRLTKPALGHLKKAGAPSSRHLAEFRLPKQDDSSEPPKIGDQVTVEAFEPGQTVKVSGTSKGKGFQGTIKRHGAHRGPVSHGSHNVRAPGSIGASATPSRVFPGKRMPGQTGSVRVTQRGLKVVEIDANRHLLLVRGAVPGPSGAVVEVRSE
ncbi:MAG: 50S ribosomal protein L3 [Solirubrobacterales bacterium]